MIEQAVRGMLGEVLLGGLIGDFWDHRVLKNSAGDNHDTGHAVLRKKF